MSEPERPETEMQEKMTNPPPALSEGSNPNLPSGADEPAQDWGASNHVQADDAPVPKAGAAIAETAGGDGVETHATFETMGLSDPLLRGIYANGFENPSQIQQKAIVPASKGLDVVMHAQSGTGKTGAFGIGLLNRVEPKLGATQALVLSPTRDLASQTKDVIEKLGDYLGVTTHCSIGGRSGRQDAETLRRKPDVVTGTPGRVLDNMLTKRVLDPRDLKVVVLDECDVMLSEGFYDDMRTLFEHIPKDCQVVVVSATMPPEVLKITERFMRNPVKVLIPKEEVTLRGIAQFYIDCGREDMKYAVLSDLYEKLSLTQTVIFVNYRRTAMALAEDMNRDGHTVSAIHSDMEQRERETVLQEFVNGASRVLIATDILARGIDVQQVSAVMNFDLPRDKANYIHRIGRGGRFGRKAVAINLITQRDASMIGEIEQYYSTEIREMPADIEQYM